MPVMSMHTLINGLIMLITVKSYRTAIGTKFKYILNKYTPWKNIQNNNNRIDIVTTGI